MPDALLEVADVAAGYGDLQVLHGVSVAVGAGERVLVFGPNGSGKSTLLKTVCGLVRPTAGTVRLGGEQLAGQPPQRIVASGISYVPQTGNVFVNLTVAENLEVGGVLARRQTVRRAAEVMELFPLLGDHRRQLAGSLSGGERQLVALGRALMLEPQVLLLDEPSAGLAPSVAGEVFSHIVRINADRGIAVLIVEQNVVKAMDIVERGYVLETGQVRLEGSVDELRDSPDVARVYLGGSVG